MELVDLALSGSAGRARLFEVAADARARKSPELDEALDDLALRSATGNDAAVELLLELVHRLGLARPAITSVVADASRVDDISQLTLMAVERKIVSFEGRAKFRTWLHTVARNEALMSLRRRQDEPVEELPATGTRFSSVVAGRMTIERLVGSLPEPYRETLQLQLFESLEYDAIAERLGVPVGTVRSRLAKARELLRSLLEAQTRV